jgi:hypothetical protein
LRGVRETKQSKNGKRKKQQDKPVYVTPEYGTLPSFSAKLVEISPASGSDNR